MRLLLSCTLAASALAVPATEFSFNSAGKLPCDALLLPHRGTMAMPVDLDMPLELLNNLTSGVATLVPPQGVAGVAGMATLGISDSVSGKTATPRNVVLPPPTPPPLPPPVLLQDSTPKYYTDMSAEEAMYVRHLAAHSTDRMVDADSREWSAVQVHYAANYTQPDGNATSQERESTANLWVETSCQFAENGPRGDLGALPAAITGLTFTTASGHVQRPECGPSTSIPPVTGILQPAAELDGLMCTYDMRVFEPSTGMMKSLADGVTQGAYLHELRLSLSTTQRDWLNANTTLTGEAEVYCVKDLNSIMAPPPPGMSIADLADVSGNVTFSVVNPTPNAVTLDGMQQVVAGKNFDFSGHSADTRNYAKMVSFEAQEGTQEFVSASAFTRMNKAGSWSADSQTNATVTVDMCGGHVSAGFLDAYVYDFDGVKTMYAENNNPNYLLEIDASVMLPFRESLSAAEAETLLRFLAADFQSPANEVSAYAAVSAEQRAAYQKECMGCCVVDARLSLAASPDFALEADFTVIGDYCDYDGFRGKQRRIAASTFVDHFTGLKSLKLHAVHVPGFTQDMDFLTFDMHPKFIADGKMRVFVGQEYNGATTVLETDAMCPYIEDVTAEQRVLVEQVCGPLKSKPTEAPASAAATTTVTLAAAAVAAAALF